MHVAYENPPGRSGALVAHLKGRFDIGGATTFWESASQLVGEETRRIVIDMSGVTMLTSAGLGILVRLLTRLKECDGGLAIFGCNDKIREIIGLVMLIDILKVRDSENEAWDALQP